MQTYKVTLEFIGLAGKYFSEVTVKAKNEGSARKKASAYIGDRTGEVVKVEKQNA